MTTFIKVRWIHELPDEPVLLYSEVDDDGWEVRKVEVFRDGKRDWANKAGSRGSSRLSEVPFPSIEEIAKQIEFEPELIEPEEFDYVWRSAVQA